MPLVLKLFFMEEYNVTEGDNVLDILFNTTDSAEIASDLVIPGVLVTVEHVTTTGTAW